jgi:hypothetical protein
METFSGLIGLGILSWFVYALFKPARAVYWHENPSRIKAVGYLLLGMFVIGSLNPNAGSSEAGSNSKADAREESTTGEIAGLYTSKDIFDRKTTLRTYSHGKFIKRANNDQFTGDWYKEGPRSIKLIYRNGSSVEASISSNGNKKIPHFDGGYVVWEKKR